MKVNRYDWVRVLKVVRSVGVNEVKFDEEGNFGVGSGGANLLFGKGLALGRKISLLDVDKLIGMLDSFSDIEVVVEFDNSKMIISGGKELVFGYRLGRWDIVNSESRDVLEEVSKGDWKSKEFQYEDLQEVKKLIGILGEEKISFFTEDGRLVSMVGDEKVYYGKVALGDLELDKKIEFFASKFKNVLDVLDEKKVEIGFRLGEKGCMYIKEKDFCWYLARMDEVKE